MIDKLIHKYQATVKTPRELKPYLKNKDFKNTLYYNKETYKMLDMYFSYHDLASITNQWLTNEFDSKEQSFTINATTKNKIANFNEVQEINISPDDYIAGFSKDAWKTATAAQKYMIIKHAQNALNKSSHEKPAIHFLNELTSDSLAYYSKYFNSIYLNLKSIDTGVGVSQLLTHNMDYFNNITNPKDNGKIKVAGSYVSLKNYLQNKNHPLENIIDISLNDVSEWDWQEVLHYKNLISDIPYSATMPFQVKDISTFTNYMTRELHYFSPKQQSAFSTVRNTLDSMLNNKMFNEEDKLDILSRRRFCDVVNNMGHSPILKSISKKERHQLLDKYLKTNFYKSIQKYDIENDKKRTTDTLTFHSNEYDKMLGQIYNEFSDSRGQLSREL